MIVACFLQYYGLVPDDYDDLMANTALQISSEFMTEAFVIICFIKDNYRQSAVMA